MVMRDMDMDYRERLVMASEEPFLSSTLTPDYLN